MAKDDDLIDWSKTTFDGSRREQLRRWRQLSVRERLEALDRLSDLAALPAQLREKPAARQPQASYADARNEIVLAGCTPTPLASYLKAIAVLRLVTEQAGHPDATGHWRNDEFVLRTRLTKDQLTRFFLEDYAPTPLVAPWGARSGFYQSSSENAARQALERISRSKLPRLERYRQTIQQVRGLLRAHGFNEKASDEKKLELLRICRARLPDHLLAWLDTCYTLTAEGRKFPPLLGTGGNEGSGSYVSGFAQQVVACVVDREHDRLVESALYGAISPNSYSKQTPGHFSPHALGGNNATTGFESEPLTNPWDYLLALEGTLLFAANATRRDLDSPPQVNFPFCVAPLAGGNFGYVSSEEKPAEAKRQVMEAWLPLWAKPCSIDELQALFAEGRVTLGRRVAATGLDFARAISSFGVDRGIDSFCRFAFLMRNGQSFFATSMERFRVTRRSAVDLVSDLERDGWLARLQRYCRSDDATGSLRSVGTLLDSALFQLTQLEDSRTVQKVICVLGRIEAIAKTSSEARKAIGPVPVLSVGWSRRAREDSSEFRIAVALAGMSLSGKHEGRGAHLGMRQHLAPVDVAGYRWTDDAHLVTWNEGSLERNLSAVLHRRRLEAAKRHAEEELLWSHTGARLGDAHRFIERRTDDRRIDELLRGLVCADLRGLEPPPSERWVAPLPAYALLKPFFTPNSTLRALGWLPSDRTLRLPDGIPARLVANQVDAALRIAWSQLRALGAKLPGVQPPCAAGIDGPRLLAALMIPLTYAETGRLLRALDLAPETEELDQHLQSV